LTVSVKPLPLCAGSGSVVVGVTTGGAVVRVGVLTGAVYEEVLEVEATGLVALLLLVFRRLPVAGCVGVRVGCTLLRAVCADVLAFRGGLLTTTSGTIGFVTGGA
jgi:hypothetical protein